MSDLPLRPDRKIRTYWRLLSEGTIRWFAFLCAFMSVVTTFGIVAILLGESIPFFKAVPIGSFLFGTEWRPAASPPLFGVLPLVMGTFVITIGAGLIAIPVGLLSAIYLSEYARSGVKSFLKPCMELLAGVPTVVYGYLGLYMVTPLLQKLSPEFQANNAASGAIVVAIMILPIVSSLCEDAISAVPNTLRDAAYGLGATKAEVTIKIVLPAALSGIMASFILALSRALGETMAVTLAVGSNPIMSLNPAKSMETMTTYIVSTAQGDIAVGTRSYESVFAVGVALFAMTMAMNVLANKVVQRFRRSLP